MSKAATCGAKGEEKRTCSCGASETREIAATDAHTYGEWSVTTAATCVAKGEKNRTCSCGVSENKEIPISASAHVYALDNRCTLCSHFLQATEGLEYILNQDGESYTVKKGTTLNSTTSVIIPPYHNEKNVTSIGEKAFVNCSSLTSITIPASVTSIGNYAFYECTSLTSIDIPASVSSIGRWAFYYCTSLTSVTFEDSCQLNSIGEFAFQGCQLLTSMKIPANVTYIGTSAFYNCTSLTSIFFAKRSKWNIGQRATISPALLADPAKAAIYLTTDAWNDGFSGYYWTRTEE